MSAERFQSCIGEAHDPLLIHDTLERFAINPPLVQRLVVRTYLRSRWGNDQESHIEVQVRTEVVTMVDGVDVHPDRGCEHFEALDPCLLAGLPDCDACQLVVAICMSPWLEPPPQLRVEEQQDLLGGWINHEG
jgi:hypothetical protein